MKGCNHNLQRTIHYHASSFHRKTGEPMMSIGDSISFICPRGCPDIRIMVTECPQWADDDPVARDREARIQLMMSSMRRLTANRRKRIFHLDGWAYGLMFGLIAFAVMVAATAWVFSGG